MKHEIKLQPFKVPNFVLAHGPARPRQEGFIEPPKFALHELSEATLTEMCEQFKADVLEKAMEGRTECPKCYGEQHDENSYNEDGTYAECDECNGTGFVE